MFKLFGREAQRRSVISECVFCFHARKFTFWGYEAMINSRFLRQHLIKRSRKLCVTRCKSTAASSNEWETVVGLEVHAQLNTESKLFSGAQNVFGGVVNSCVSLFDASIPGTLPVLNRRCVELAVMTSLALGCRVNEVSSFDRKHYFYADLPNGYQITQQRAPIANDGVINFQVFTPGIHKKPYQKSSRIKQIQLEQDSGKSLHDEELKRSLVDLNRAGAPLIELVFEPDLQDGEEAAALVKELLLVLRRLRASGGRQQEGALRVDANVSVRRPGGPLGTRTEIKNIGSVRGVAGAVRHEARRQRALLARGGRVRGETRAWDAAARVTVPLRDKEEVLDYRYMPEPNLPPLWVNLHSTADSEDVVSVPLIRDSIPELPEETRRNLIDNFHLRPETAIQLVNEPKLLDYFQSLTTEGRDPVKVANLLINELLTAINKARVEPDLCSVPEEHLAQLTDLLLDRKVNLEVVRKTLDELLVEGNEKSPLTIIEENSWLLVGDDEEITRLCMEIIEGNPKLVKQYRQGKVKVFNALLGIFAKNTQNRVDMARASQRLEELLKSDE